MRRLPEDSRKATNSWVNQHPYRHELRHRIKKRKLTRKCARHPESERMANIEKEGATTSKVRSRMCYRFGFQKSLALCGRKGNNTVGLRMTRKPKMRKNHAGEEGRKKALVMEEQRRRSRLSRHP